VQSTAIAVAIAVAVVTILAAISATGIAPQEAWQLPIALLLDSKK